MADPKELQKKISKVVSTRGVRIETHYVAPGYEVSLTDKATLGKTGLLRSLEISCKTPRMPSFLGRWDDPVRMLDLDLITDDPAERHSFKHGCDGSSGHHSTRTTAHDMWEFEVNIVYHHTPIFEGLVQLSLDVEEGLTLGVETDASFTAEVTHADPKRS